MSRSVAATIVLADDDEADRMLTRRALRKAAIGNEVLEVSDGPALMRALRGEAEFAGREAVDFVLLDLSMPGMDGLEVLSLIDGDSTLRGVPVVVLTGSDDRSDIRAAYRSGAASYLAKPVTFEGIQRAVRELDGYSIAIVRDA